MVRMTFPESMNDKTPSRLPRLALAAIAVAATLACAGCEAPIDMEHRVSFEVHASPKDLRACVVEAIRGIDGVPGVNPPSSGIEQSFVGFRTTLPYVSGEVERVGSDGLRVSIEVMQHVEPDNFWSFAQPRTKAIGEAIVAKCGAL